MLRRGSASSSSARGGCIVSPVGKATMTLLEDDVEVLLLCVKMEDTLKTLCPIGGAVVPSSAARNVAAACFLALSIVYR